MLKQLLFLYSRTIIMLIFQILKQNISIDIIFIEEMQRQFIIPILSKDGRQINMQVRQKNQQLSKRRVKTWTNQQDNQLLELYERLPKKWSEIAALMNDRNENQCLHRYRRLVQLGKSHKIWSAQEDQTIMKLIKKYGKNWKLISEMLGSKNGKQIRQRYINKLDPKIKKEDWTQEQDRKILQLYSKIGSKWSQISKNLLGRPENKIKNRFYSFIQKNYDIKFKQVENIDPKEIITHPKPTWLNENKQMDQLKSFHILQAKQDNRLEDDRQDRLYSKFQMPSINQIDFQLKNQLPISNNLLESVLRVDDQWRLGQNYQSILQLRSTDFFPRLSN